jgi:hypothetical protein
MTAPRIGTRDEWLAARRASGGHGAGEGVPDRRHDEYERA